jgi:hypothetical protein
MKWMSDGPLRHTTRSSIWGSAQVHRRYGQWDYLVNVRGQEKRGTENTQDAAKTAAEDFIAQVMAEPRATHERSQ